MGLISQPSVFAGEQPPRWCRYPLRQDPGGIMLHYDGSRTDAGSLTWFRDPRCKAGYHFLVLDSGESVTLGGLGVRAWHAGDCKPSATFAERGGYRWPNSFFVGVCAATNDVTPVTPEQLDGLARLCAEIFERYGWSLGTEAWRVTGHEDEAYYAPKPRYPKHLWGKRGRKQDPTPAFSVDQVVGRMMEMRVEGFRQRVGGR